MQFEAQRGRASVFALPGVPAEMHEMWQQTVVPAITLLQPEPRVIRHRRIKCFGVGESQLEAMLPDLVRRGREPRVGITVSDATITLRITATGREQLECFQSMETTIATIRDALGNLVFGEEDDELQHVVLKLLADKQSTLAVAEWATEGILTAWLKQEDEASGTLIGGSTVANTEQFAELIEPEPLPADFRADSSPAATFLAEAAARLSGADYALGIAAYPVNTERPDAKVHISLFTPVGIRKLRFGCASHPAIKKPRTAKQALNALRLTLLGEEGAQ